LDPIEVQAFVVSMLT
jgi:hypothetical protein